MIILQPKHKIKNLNNKIYNDIVGNLDIKNLRCSCHNDNCFIHHGTYTRKLSFLGCIHRINIIRVKCKCCNKTHAILIETIIPYFINSYNDIININISNDADSSYLAFIRSFCYLSYKDICNDIIKRRNNVSIIFFPT